MRYVSSLLLLLFCSGVTCAAEWSPLTEDGVHDPGNPALDLLQEPAEALSQLPPDTAGNQVRWVEALRNGYIAPRTNIWLPGIINAPVFAFASFLLSLPGPNCLFG